MLLLDEFSGGFLHAFPTSFRLPFSLESPVSGQESTTPQKHTRLEESFCASPHYGLYVDLLLVILEVPRDSLNWSLGVASTLGSGSR